MMNLESDGSPSTETSTAESTPREYVIEEIGKKDRRWRLVVQPSDLELYEEGDAQPFIVLREQLQRDVVLVEGMRVLGMKKPKKATFKLPPEAVTAVADWIGSPVLAAFYLKRRYAWVLPLAIIWILGSLPVAADPARGIEATSLDAVGLGLGGVLVIAWAFAKWRPHPVLFLVDSVWFLCLAGYLTREVFNGRSRLWMILVGLLLWMVITGFRYFVRFRGVAISPDARRNAHPGNSK